MTINASPSGPWWDAALDLLLPPRCVGCGRRGVEVCGDCVAAMRALGLAICPRCALPSNSGGICRRCIGREHAVRAILAAYPFEGVIRSAILAFKYRSRRKLRPFLVSALSAALDARPLSIDVVVAVPLSPGRLRDRGYNPAAVLAAELGSLRGWPTDFSALARTRDTLQQTRLPARERRRNVEGAFAVDRPHAVAGKRILLVDDVCTTGSTLDACATAILGAGAAGVWAVVVAREGPPARP